MSRLLPLGLVTAAVLAAPALPVRGQEPAPRPDVIYVPTPQEVVDRMLELADVTKDDVLYDLGCGDGRIVVTAAKRFGAKAVGIDIDPERVRESRENVRKNGVADRVTIRQEDLFTADFNGASVVTLYLLPNLNTRLMPRLARLKPGTRIVSHSFELRGAKPKRVEKVRLAGDEESYRTVYYYVVPWENEPAG
jgi:tRNA G37 N-methylase Trm5